jgi:hypothetical protein
VLQVSPNVVWTLVPTVRAAFIDAVFTFDSVKKAALTQKKSTFTINGYAAVLSLRLTGGTCARYASLHDQMSGAEGKGLKM